MYNNSRQEERRLRKVYNSRKDSRIIIHNLSISLQKPKKRKVYVNYGYFTIFLNCVALLVVRD